MHGVWSALNVHTGTPVNAVWAMAALAFLLGLPMLYSLSVFNALVSISSIGLYVSCESPFRGDPHSPPAVLAKCNHRQGSNYNYAVVCLHFS